MSQRTLLRLLGALGVVAVLWIAVSLVSNRATDAQAEVEGAIATFFEGVNESTVSAARFSYPNDPSRSVELRKVGDQWQVNGFRSDSGSVARFFEVLAGSKASGVAAANPANHARMGVAADTAPRLELDVSGVTRTLLVGIEGPRVTTVYARIPDEDSVYVLQSGVRSYVFRSLEDWRNRRMVRIDTAQVRRITIERDGRSFELVRSDSTWTFGDGAPVNTSQVSSLLNELGAGVVASRFIADADSLGRLPQAGRTVVFGASGEQLAAVTVGSGTGDRWGMVAGDSVRYRLPPFRVDAVVPTLASVRP